jgi:transposase InsO family protein
MDDEDKRDLALWRLGVLGPLISARLEHGDRQAYFRAAAERVHERPDGRLVRLSARTIEAWFHAWRRGGFGALVPSVRTDRGTSRAIGPAAAALIVRLKRERPRRSIRRIIRVLERARVVRRGELSKSSVHRLLAAQGVSQRPGRGPAAERRSFLVEHAGDLWLGDALHGPLVTTGTGRLGKAYLLSQLDVATRYVPHSYFALSEDAVAHEYGLKQALLKAGLVRTYYVDLGAAYVSRSLRLICAELAIHLLHTAPRDCEAKGAIERWHRSWREEVGDELAGRTLTLAELNAIHWAWLASEYHARVHETTGRAPREHWLDEAARLRPLPKEKNLDEVFLHRERRDVRKDATVRFRGRLLEVRAELVGRRVELRFDPSDPGARPRVFLDDRFVCDTVALDRLRNATRRRRRPLGQAAPQVEPSGLDPLGLIERDHYARTHVGRDDDQRED